MSWEKSIRLWAMAFVCFIFGITITESTWAVEKPKDYPNRPITIFIGFSAGGATDTGVRILIEPLKKIIKQNVLVENKPGAGSQTMHTYFLKNAKPDGYEMAMFNVPQIQSIMFDPTRKFPYSFKDYQPVVNHVDDLGALMVRKESPFKTIEDLMAAVKANPGKISATTGGVGSTQHLALLKLESLTGLKFNPVHLLGTPEQQKAVLGGHVDVDCNNIGIYLDLFESGMMRPLVLLTDKRYPDLPNVPTFKEKGINLISSSTRGFVFPKGTPMEIVKYMEESLKKAMEDPTHIKRMKEMGLVIKFMGVEEYTRFLEEKNTEVKTLMGLYRK